MHVWYNYQFMCVDVALAVLDLAQQLPTAESRISFKIYEWSAYASASSWDV